MCLKLKTIVKQFSQAFSLMLLSHGYEVSGMMLCFKYHYTLPKKGTRSHMNRAEQNLKEIVLLPQTMQESQRKRNLKLQLDSSDTNNKAPA